MLQRGISLITVVFQSDRPFSPITLSVLQNGQTHVKSIGANGARFV